MLCFFDVFLGLVSHFDDITVRSMRALYSTTEEWDKLVRESGGSSSLKNLNNAGLPLSVETEKKILLAFQTLIKIELNEKETTVEEDIKILSEFEDSKLRNSVNNGNKKNKKEKVAKTGFAGNEKENEILLEKSVVNKIERELEIDPSGYYSDGEFAALTFRIEKKKILLDALEKAEI